MTSSGIKPATFWHSASTMLPHAPMTKPTNKLYSVFLLSQGKSIPNFKMIFIKP
jgi:hypothetical protein